MITFKEFGNYGRLGNQMFQFALLAAISNKTGFDFILPSTKYTKNIPINLFEGVNNVYNEQEYNNYVKCNKFRNQYVEPYFHFSNNVFDQLDDTNYLGYFQSYKYFDDIKDKLINEYFKNDQIEEQAICDLRNLKNGDKKLVAIHVRHGDYLNYPTTHPICSEQFYHKAIETICNYSNTPSCEFRYVIFSDDEYWCKFAFEKYDSVYLANKDPVYCIMAMKNCDHNIIANSSFSWWGAYLGWDKDKSVIYPQKWFGVDGPQDYYDLCPQSWVAL